MKKENYCFLLIFGLFFLSCSQNNNQPQQNEIITLDANKNEIKIDTSLVTIADLPIKIDSISYLIHPIGIYKFKRYDDGFLYKSSKSSVDDFKLTNNYEDVINGNINNLLFQGDKESKFTSLTKDKIKIKSVTFLRDLFDVTKRKVFVYEVVDTDTNKDKKLDLQDLFSIYFSNVDGSNFKKMSKPNQRIINTKFIKSNSKFYFKTVEKNDDEDKNEVFHYFFIDMSSKNFEVKEYFPVKE